MPMSLDQFAKALATSGLFSAEDVKEFWSSLAAEERPKIGEAFAELLTARGRLSKFQADELLAGRGPGLRMGDYVLEGELGAGGMGKVYKARHRTMDRIVALKVMSVAAMKDEAAVKRFQREVRAAARLEHSNIVTAYDSGQAGSVQYLVMQFVDGGDLSSRVKRDGPLPVETAVEYVAQAAQGLAFAHGASVIHRDIKPANLLVDKKGLVKILDLGLARIDDAASSDGLTATEQVMGTVDYMAPEQAADTKHVDARADIYSLGCTFWYLLTGQRMYDGNTMVQRIMKHRDAPLPSLVKTRDDVPWSLEQVFHKMVAKHPQDRQSSMDEVLAELDPHRPTHGAGSKTGLESGMTRGPTNAELSAFLKSVGPTTMKSSTAQVAAAVDATLHYAKASSDTDPKSEVVGMPLAPPPEAKPGSTSTMPVSNTPASRRPLLLSGATGAVLLVAGAIWFFAKSETDPKDRPTEPPPAAKSAIPPTAGRLPPPAAKAPFDAASARQYQKLWADHLGTSRETTNSLGMKLTLIPPGEFLMGSTDAEIHEYVKTIETNSTAEPRIKSEGVAKVRSEGPRHRVVLSKPFYLGTVEVTFGQFRKFAEATSYITRSEQLLAEDASKTDSTWRTSAAEHTDEHPVNYVCWNDAIAFCNWLNKQEGLADTYQTHPTLGMVPIPGAIGYRLPTEAEWEFACRAGTTTRYFWGDDAGRFPQYAAHRSLSAVGSLVPNSFGLHDTIGNVWEYCQDRHSHDYYAQSPTTDPPGPVEVKIMLRGSSYNSGGKRTAERNNHSPEGYTAYYGFRIARGIAVSGPAMPAATATGSAVVAPILPTPTAASTTRAAPSFLPAMQVPSGNYALSIIPYGSGTSAFAVPDWNYTGETPLTIEAWLTTKRAVYQIFFGHNKGGPGISMTQHPDSTLICGGLKSNVKLEVDRRTHFAVTLDRGELRMFIDGVAQSGRKQFEFKPSPTPFYLGGAMIDGAPGTAVTALFDEVRISRVVRYQSDFKPAERHEPDADTEALYHFDEGSGDTTKDASPHGRHVQLKNARWANLDGSPIKLVSAP